MCFVLTDEISVRPHIFFYLRREFRYQWFDLSSFDHAHEKKLAPNVDADDYYTSQTRDETLEQTWN